MTRILEDSDCEMLPGGMKLLQQVTYQVRIGKRTGSCHATESYTTLVINAIIQTRLPVL